MTETNVFYEIDGTNTLFKRTITKYPKHKVQTKEAVGSVLKELNVKFGDVYLSQNEKRYVQIVDLNDENNTLAYRVYEPDTSLKGFVSRRVYTTKSKFRSDLYKNRFELY